MNPGDPVQLQKSIVKKLNLIALIPIALGILSLILGKALLASGLLVAFGLLLFTLSAYIKRLLARAT